MSSLLQPAAVVALANARLRDVEESLQRKLDAATVNAPSGGLGRSRFGNTERRVLGLARAAAQMVGGPDPVPMPVTNPLYPGPSAYAVLGSAGFEIPAYADVFAPGGGWRTDFMRRGTADPNLSLVDVPTSDFLLELARRARSEGDADARRRAEAFTMGVLGAVAHGAVMSPVQRGALAAQGNRDWSRHDPGAFLSAADAQALRRLVGTAAPVEAWRSWWPTAAHADQLWDLYLGAVQSVYPFEQRPDRSKGFPTFEAALRTGDPLSRARIAAGYERMLTDVVPWGPAQWFGVLTPILLSPAIANLITRALPHSSHFTSSAPLTDRSFSELITLSNGIGAVTPFIYSMIMWAKVPDHTEPFGNALALFFLRLGLALGWIPTIGTEQEDPSPVARWAIAGSMLGADVYAMIRAIASSGGGQPGATLVFGLQTVPGMVTIAALVQAALTKAIVAAAGDDGADVASWTTWAVTTVGLWLGAGLPIAFALAKGGGWLSWFFRNPPDSIAAAAALVDQRAEPTAAAHVFDDSTLWHDTAVASPTLADLRYPSGMRPLFRLWWTGSGTAEVSHDGHVIQVRHDGTTKTVQIGPGARDAAKVVTDLNTQFPNDLHAELVDTAPVYDLPWPSTIADPGDGLPTVAEHDVARTRFVELPSSQAKAYVIRHAPRATLTTPLGLASASRSAFAGVRVVPHAGLGDVDDTGLGTAADLAVLLSLGAASRLRDVTPPTPAPTGAPPPAALATIGPVSQVFRRWNLDDRRANEWRELVSGSAAPDVNAPPVPAGTADGRAVADAMGWVPLWRAWLRMASDTLADSSAAVPAAYAPTITAHDGRSFRPTNAELTAGIRYLLDLPA